MKRDALCLEDKLIDAARRGRHHLYVSELPSVTVDLLLDTGFTVKTCLNTDMRIGWRTNIMNIMENER